jgi:hypothetical protein
MKRLIKQRKRISCAISVFEVCVLCLKLPCERDIENVCLQSTTCHEGHIISPFGRPSICEKSPVYFHS